MVGFTGTVCAGWFAELMHFVSRIAQSALAFITGTLGMRLIGGMIVLGDNFRKDPTAIGRQFNLKNSPILASGAGN